MGALLTLVYFITPFCSAFPVDTFVLCMIKETGLQMR